MSAFHYAHAGDEPDWQILADQCLQQLAPIPLAANLGFIYFSDTLNAVADDILGYLRRNSGVEHWVGSIGAGICATGQDYFDTPALAVMLGEFPADSFHVFNNVQDDLRDFHATHAGWYSDRQALLGIVHGDPRNGHIPQLLSELTARLEEGFLVGGLSSSRQHHLQVSDGITEGGLSGVLFANEVPVLTGLSQGCLPIGPRHEITECRQNIAVRLDGRPALDVFMEDIGEELAADLKQTAGHIFAALAIPGSDTGDYLVRNLVGLDIDKRLLAVGDLLTPGTQLLFTRRDPGSARADLIKQLKRLKQRLGGKLPRGGLYYSCLGRGPHLFGPNAQELRLIQSYLGDFPLVGFFANGEISHNRLYAYTGVLTLFV